MPREGGGVVDTENVPHNAATLCNALGNVEEVTRSEILLLDIHKNDEVVLLESDGVQSLFNARLEPVADRRRNEDEERDTNKCMLGEEHLQLPGPIFLPCIHVKVTLA